MMDGSKQEASRKRQLGGEGEFGIAAAQERGGEGAEAGLQFPGAGPAIVLNGHRLREVDQTAVQEQRRAGQVRRGFDGEAVVAAGGVDLFTGNGFVHMQPEKVVVHLVREAPIEFAGNGVANL